MIAPELIGLERIRRIENGMEKSAQSLLRVIDPLFEYFFKSVFTTNRGKVILRIATGLGIIVFLIAVIMGFTSNIY